MARPLTDKRYLYPEETAGTVTDYIYHGRALATLPTPPTGITLTNSNPSVGWIRVQITPSTLVASSWSGVVDVGDQTFTIYVNTVAMADRFKIVPSCCTGNRNIMWFNRFGGYQNWNFDVKRTDSINIQGEEVTFEDDLDLVSASVGKVYPGEAIDVLMGNKNHIDVVSRMKYALRHWLYNSTTGDFDTPIKMLRESFDKYNNGRGNRFFDFGFKYLKRREEVQRG